MNHILEYCPHCEEFTPRKRDGLCPLCSGGGDDKSGAILWWWISFAAVTLGILAWLVLKLTTTTL